MEYDYTISPLAVDALTAQIQASTIVTALDHINALGSAVAIFFKAALSDADKTTLDAVVAAHTGVPLPNNTSIPVSVTSQPAVVINQSPPYGSKTVVISGVTKHLYARNTGFQSTLTTGSNTLTYTLTYAWCKLLGVEVINCEALDYVDFKVFDTSTGTYSGVPNAMLNQFAYSHNLPKDYYQRMSEFDADIYAGMIISVTYTSVSAKTVGINLLMDEVRAS